MVKSAFFNALQNIPVKNNIFFYRSTALKVIIQCKRGNFMKKILSITLVILTLCFVVSCKNDVDLKLYLSQARLKVYSYSQTDYTLTAYYEEKESPFILDGYVGKIKKYLVLLWFRRRCLTTFL